MNAHAASGRRWQPAPLDEAGSATVPRRQGYHGSPWARSGYAVRAGAASYSECGSRISCMPWTPWSTRSALDETSYPTAREVTPPQLGSLAIKQEKFHGEWNYTIQTRT